MFEVMAMKLSRWKVIRDALVWQKMDWQMNPNDKNDSTAEI